MIRSIIRALRRRYGRSSASGPATRREGRPAAGYKITYYDPQLGIASFFEKTPAAVSAAKVWLDANGFHYKVKSL